MNTNPPSPRKPIPPAAQHLLHKRSGIETDFLNGFMLPNRNRHVSLKIHVHAHTYAWDVDNFLLSHYTLLAQWHRRRKPPLCLMPVAVQEVKKTTLYIQGSHLKRMYTICTKSTCTVPEFVLFEFTCIAQPSPLQFTDVNCESIGNSAFAGLFQRGIPF